jgi:hypothetical protein
LTLKTPPRAEILVFTEFVYAARYLKQQLIAGGIDGVGQADSATKGNRVDIILADSVQQVVAGLRSRLQGVPRKPLGALSPRASVICAAFLGPW